MLKLKMIEERVSIKGQNTKEKKIVAQETNEGINLTVENRILQKKGRFYKSALFTYHNLWST